MTHFLLQDKDVQNYMRNVAKVRSPQLDQVLSKFVSPDEKPNDDIRSESSQETPMKEKDELSSS